ncbi:class I SAM-dependent methyltransferase [[Mycobacterium] appelbergii]|uniref:class I SAM-dependent methyltransferase n=1 Tax=[Mycobacterium] appelbergii TaxID=2939269 RepID=UPI003977D35C
MTDYHPDYLPAAGRDGFLPAYDQLTRALGMGAAYNTLISQAELTGKVLEIGCGTGNLTVRAKLAQPGVELIGCDPDPLALARARRKAQGLTGIQFERAYAQRLPFADGEFDRVLSSMMLHHLDQDTKVAAAAEIARVLRPGGRLHLVDVGGHMTRQDGVVARYMLRGHHINGNLGDAIPRLLSDAGLDCTQVATQRRRRLGRLSYYRAVRT